MDTRGQRQIAAGMGLGMHLPGAHLTHCKLNME